MKPIIRVQSRSLNRLAGLAGLAAAIGTLSGCIVAKTPEFARMEERRETRTGKEMAKREGEEWKKKEAKAEEERHAKAAAAEKDKLYREIEAQVESAQHELRFDSGSYKVPNAAQRELRRLGELLSKKGAEDARVRLAGYSDNRGSESKNMRLSQQRAQAVRQILLDNGARISQLEVEGRGTENPVASNRTEDGRAQNRRVEMEISGIPTG